MGVRWWHNVGSFGAYGSIGKAMIATAAIGEVAFRFGSVIAAMARTSSIVAGRAIGHSISIGLRDASPTCNVPAIKSIQLANVFVKPNRAIQGIGRMITLATLASLAMILYGVSGLFRRRPIDTTPAQAPIDPNYYPKPWRG